MAQVTAPPHLVALLPEAAMATVAAGHTNTSSEVSTQAPAFTISINAHVHHVSVGTPAEKETVLIVGDTRYAWQEWSKWHCNCMEGSMSRVRDITYAMPGVHLDPVQYDILRFEREVCSYKVCDCSRKEHECDRLEVTCKKGAMHMCALRDIKLDQDLKRRHFWARVHEGLNKLWQHIKDTFPMEEVGKRGG
ncbi:protein MENT [Rhineura floridana]|uniref:protein MENT n=1 Tax=Rhineura floridana TaxID=261503 RepID=UPI002AC84355|nr:protein MENT [Rhineura floridana]